MPWNMNTSLQMYTHSVWKNLKDEKRKLLVLLSLEMHKSRPSFWKLTKFSFTMPSLAAKKARTCEMKYLSSGFRASQC